MDFLLPNNETIKLCFIAGKGFVHNIGIHCLLLTDQIGRFLCVHGLMAGVVELVELCTHRVANKYICILFSLSLSIILAYKIVDKGSKVIPLFLLLCIFSY